MDDKFKATIEGKWAGRSADFRRIRPDLGEITDLNGPGITDWVTCNFKAEWNADALRSLQELFWKRFKGHPHGQGIWVFEKGNISDIERGNTWPVNSFGRYMRDERENDE